MPAPIDTETTHRLRYVPGLDGLRAIAVLGVMAYHGGVSFLPAGFFGVDAFFVLSGFLITSLLVAEWHETGHVKLAFFWARRARRLLPALLLLLVAVVLYVRFATPEGSYPDLRLDSFATLFYVANWHFIWSGQNYFVANGPTSPLLHTWSLAIEEQFYIVWPLVVLGTLRRARTLWPLLWIAIAGAVASAVEMGLLFHPGVDPTRVYFGTDTHAQCLLVGAALSIALAIGRRSRPEPARSARTARIAQLAGAAGVVVTAVAWSRLQFTDSFVFRGGFLVVALAVAAVLSSVVLVPTGLLSRALSVRPLVFLGRISYGMYLWHFPLDQLALTHATTGLAGWWLLLVRTVVTVVISTVSFVLVEHPIRIGTLLTSVRALLITPVAVVTCAVVVLVATSTPGLAITAPKATPGGQLPATPIALTPAEATSTAPVRVLLTGDSVSLTLGVGLAMAEAPYHVEIADEGIIGCGVAVASTYESHGTVSPMGWPCNTDPALGGTACTPPGSPVQQICQAWTSAWPKWIAEERPNVVVFLGGRWEVMNTFFHGRWTDILQPSYAAYVRQQLAKAVSIATASGARMVLMTAPCYSSGEQPNGDPWPEDDPARVEEYNRLIRQVAAAHPREVSVQDLDSYVCPGGHFTLDLHGARVRDTDGVHFSHVGLAVPAGTGGDYLAPAILPYWEDLGHVQEASTGGASVVPGPIPTASQMAPS